ncbi:hypothetical protein TNCV_1679051 [Trichonephila clavipes]|nr:hypothetical protein TNCV_1679051 [Trichonephila clavipes]
MPNPVQSNCDAHDTTANGQYGAVWSMGHTTGLCAYSPPLPSNVWQQFFGRSAFLRQQETDLPPAELWCACSLLIDDISVFCRRRTSNTTSPCRSTTHSSRFKMTSTAVKQRCERWRTPWQHLLFFALLRSFQ